MTRYRRYGPKKFDPSRFTSPSITLAQVQQTKKVFDIFDQEQQGIIQTKQLLKQMQMLGFAQNNPSLFKLIADFSQGNQGEIDFQ